MEFSVPVLSPGVWLGYNIFCISMGFFGQRVCPFAIKTRGIVTVKLKRILCGLLAALLAGTCAPAAFADESAAAAAPPASLCAAYIVADADTGQVLIEKNADDQRYPASITKIMTLGLALEKAQGNLNTELTVTYDDVHRLEQDSSHVALQEGEVVRLEDVLYATEMMSANDGANVLSAYVGGSIDGGVEAMNAKAQELGMTGTHYVTPHGLHDDDHYTTARDMVTVTRWALQQPGFLDIFTRSETWTMPPTNKQEKARPFSINDWMRLSGKYYRGYAKGSKTGFTNQAGYTFVSYAEKNDIRLICVVLGAPQRYDKFIDACALLDYCYASFTRKPFGTEEVFKVPVAGGGDALGHVTVSGAQANLLMHRDTPADAVTVEYNIPEELVLGQPFGPTATFTVAETAGQAASSMTSKLEYTGLDQVLEASTYVPLDQKSKRRAGIWGTLLGLVLIGVCIMLMLRLRGTMKHHRGKGSGRHSSAGGPHGNSMPAPGPNGIYFRPQQRPHGSSGPRRRGPRK